MAQVRIGTSGWDYDSWRGNFYPERLPKRRRLEHASRRFDSIEINGTFYSLKKPSSFRAWYEQTPPGFVFAVKGSRFITHNKKLKDAETPLANFFASGVLLLRDKLGPFVWQLPANMKFNRERVAEFFALLPRDTHAAAKLAQKHDVRVKGRSWIEPGAKRRLRHALEIRNESFFDAELVRLARSAGVALVFSDSADWPYTEEITAGFIYVRLHGHERTYASSYSARELHEWGTRVRAWQRGQQPRDARRLTDREPPARTSRDVYVYFDNDAEGRAPANATALAEALRETALLSTGGV
jgi:uncharacterized protein YecE (DUF72 family)